MESQQILERGRKMQKRYPLPPFSPWPTSHAGPYATPPLPGYIPVPRRPEQVLMVADALEQGYLERGYWRALVDETTS